MTGPAPSGGFHLLHPKIQKWLWDQKWPSLREVQERAIPPIIEGQRDVLIAAATAGGKTEAAFLPICSRLAEGAVRGVRALYVGPLKALINDQRRRLEDLCRSIDVPVTPWHGDVAGSKKQRLLKDPSGILLITPESLEALFVLRGTRVATLFEGLEHVVIDELHAFIGTERGIQLQSLIHRLEQVLRRRIPRVGLSATLGDMDMAAGCLRPGGGDAVEKITSTADGRELKMQLRGYVVRPPRISAQEIQALEASGALVDLEDTLTGDCIDISHHLFQVLRGKDNLVFANRRTDTELYADLLRRLCEKLGVPVEFFPHHGNLSKELREDVEARLKDPGRPTTAVCTTTLEMGIDIGSVESVAQVGPSATVAGMLQRLGRSGRRDSAAILRLYIQEKELDPSAHLQDRLRARLVQTLAMLNLLLEGWCEPPDPRGLHLSTLLQQTLSVIAQYGGIRPQDAFRLLCQGGPFRTVDAARFGDLLKAMGKAELLVQAQDGTLLHGALGERLVNHYDFYAVFMSADEYRLVHRGRSLGSLPVSQPLFEGAFLIFGGRRWRVLSVEPRQKVVELEPAAGGHVPFFEGAGWGQVHDRIREEMRAIYAGKAVPPLLDKVGLQLLAEGRATFASYELGARTMIQDGPHVLLFPWCGDRALSTLALQLRAVDLPVEELGLALQVSHRAEGEVRDRLRALLERPPEDPEALAALVENKLAEKYDEHLGEGLLCADFAARRIDVAGGLGAARGLVGE